MPELNINAATTSNYSGIDPYQIAPKQTDGPTGQKEFEWTNEKATLYNGYFSSQPDLRSAILMKAIWNVGKGYTADSTTKVVLDHISGWGKDTFNDILFNMEVCRRVYGDAFAEIIRADDKAKTILNLKVLDPASIKIIVNQQGQIIRYEQFSKTGANKQPTIFQPEEMLHLANNRYADNVHGVSDIEALIPTILAEAQSFDNTNKLMAFQAKPFIIFKMKTDDETKIATFVAKVQKARKLGEDMFIPDDENVLEYEVIQINPSDFILAWRNDIKSKFYRSLGLPTVIFGNAGGTESGSKVEYLAHEQVFERDQLYIEQQLWKQLRIKIDLYPPTSLLENLQADESKDAQNAITTQPQDASGGRDS